jgi:hypothetical protein
MPTAAQFLRTFERAGFLVTMAWAPAGGGVAADFKARFEAGGAPVLAGMVTAAEPAITFETARVPALTNGDMVYASGNEYKVRDVTPLYDGTLTKALLRKTT